MGDKDQGDHPGTENDHEMTDAVVISLYPSTQGACWYVDNHLQMAETLMSCYRYHWMWWGKAIAVWVIDDEAVNTGAQGGSSDDDPVTAGMSKTFN